MRILVLYVDRDGDLKAQGIVTPVVGRDEVLRLGIRYILSNPDDSDANAIFAAVKIFDRLAAEHGADNVNVAVVSGSPDEMADVVVARELEQVLSLYDADAIYFVSDGPSDEAAVPAIQAKRPVISINRVVVKQARRVEETVTLFRHYFNKAVREPEYRRYTVGIPALLVFTSLLGSVLNLDITRYLVFPLLFISFFFVTYGFGIYDFLRNLLKKFEVTFIITLASLFVIVLHITAVFAKVYLLPDYVTAAISILPYISYLLEAYVKTRSIRYGGIVAGGVTFFFFYFLFPKLLMPYNVTEVLWSTAMFLVAVFITVAVTQVVRLKTR
ncbi:MAG: DUF373 family protein [Pyrobaculum sp.]